MGEYKHDHCTQGSGIRGSLSDSVDYLALLECGAKGSLDEHMK